MTTKQQTRGQVVAMYAPRRIPSRVDPGSVEQTIRVSKAVEFSVPIVASLGETVTVAMIMTAVPGGLTFWSRMRVNSIKVWGAPATVGSDPPGISVQAATGTGFAPTSWVDMGTAGARRSHVAFIPGLLEASMWSQVASTSPVFSVRSVPNADAQTVLVQASIELLSPAPPPV
jgi:hypothetical protein